MKRTTSKNRSNDLLADNQKNHKNMSSKISSNGYTITSKVFKNSCKSPSFIKLRRRDQGFLSPSILIADYYNFHLITIIADEIVTSSDLRPQTALALLALIFGVAGIFLVFVYSSFPEMEEAEAQYVKFPKVMMQNLWLDHSYTLFLPYMIQYCYALIYRISKTQKDWVLSYQNIKIVTILKYFVEWL